MSKIIEKVFDAGKKIVMSIFKGSPNLITSADLNRQIEAIKYQLDMLDDKTGIVSDMQITHSLSSGTLSVSYTLSYLYFKGCSFSPAVKSLTTNMTLSAPTAYLCLTASKKTLTYDTDSSHDIAGAKFSDGTSLPAANQVVYENEEIVITHALSSLSNLVGIIAVFNLSDTGNVVVKSNVINDKDSLSLNKGGVISDFNPTLSGKISNGKTYDEAFSILENRFNNLVPNWTNFVSMGDTPSDTDIRFRLQNGVLYVDVPSREIVVITTKISNYIRAIATLPSAIRSSFVSMLNSLDLDSRGKFIAEGCVSLGELGTFPMFSDYQTANEGQEVYPRYGLAKLCLFLSYSDTSTISDVTLGIYLDHYVQFMANGKNTFVKGPVDWLAVQTATVYVQRVFAAIPLMGKL